MKNKFYFNSKTQFENFGDAVISRELLKLARTKGEIHILAKNTPEDFLKIIDHESYIKHRSNLGFIISIISCLFKGINIYYLLNPGGFGGGVNKKEIIKQNFIILIYAILSLFGVKLIRLGASLTNLSDKKGKLESRKSNYIHYNSYRDNLSMEIAKKNNIRTNDCFPDMAFLISTHLEKNKEKNGIILSFRNRNESIVYDVLKKSIDKISFLQNEKILFSSQVDFDFSFNKDLERLFTSNGYDASEINFSDKELYFELYKNTKLVLSNRLHVLLFSLVSGTRAIAMIEQEHDEKIIGIFKDLGLESLICDLDKIEEFDWNKAKETSIDFIRERINIKKEEIYTKFNLLIEDQYQ